VSEHRVILIARAREQRYLERGFVAAGAFVRRHCRKDRNSIAMDANRAAAGSGCRGVDCRALRGSLARRNYAKVADAIAPARATTT